MTFRTKSRGHVVVTSGPRAWGGQDLGFEPTEYVALALSTCILTVIQHWVMEELDVPADEFDIEVAVRYEKSKQFGLTDFAVDVSSHLCREHWAEMRDVVSSCPVHKTLKDRVTRVNFLT